MRHKFMFLLLLDVFMRVYNPSHNAIIFIRYEAFTIPANDNYLMISQFCKVIPISLMLVITIHMDCGN